MRRGGGSDKRFLRRSFNRSYYYKKNEKEKVEINNRKSKNFEREEEEDEGDEEDGEEKEGGNEYQSKEEEKQRRKEKKKIENKEKKESFDEERDAIKSIEESNEKTQDKNNIICPLCVEVLDETDRNFFPCDCGYQICLWCLYYIRDHMSNKCPACRRSYNEKKFIYNRETHEKLFKKQKNQHKNKNENTNLSKCDLYKNSNIYNIHEYDNLLEIIKGIRVVQRNLVFVIGITSAFAKKAILKKSEYFGKYGKILNIIINKSQAYNPHYNGPSFSAYITYSNEKEAINAIYFIDGMNLDNKILKASFGTTKYCSSFLKNSSCSNEECFYLHELGNVVDSFSKDDIHGPKHLYHDLLYFYFKKLPEKKNEQSYDSSNNLTKYNKKIPDTNKTTKNSVTEIKKKIDSNEDLLNNKKNISNNPENKMVYKIYNEWKKKSIENNEDTNGKIGEELKKEKKMKEIKSKKENISEEKINIKSATNEELEEENANKSKKKKKKNKSEDMLNDDLMKDNNNNSTYNYSKEKNYLSSLQNLSNNKENNNKNEDKELHKKNNNSEMEDAYYLDEISENYPLINDVRFEKEKKKKMKKKLEQNKGEYMKIKEKNDWQQKGNKEQKEIKKQKKKNSNNNIIDNNKENNKIEVENKTSCTAKEQRKGNEAQNKDVKKMYYSIDNYFNELLDNNKKREQRKASIDPLLHEKKKIMGTDKKENLYVEYKEEIEKSKKKEATNMKGDLKHKKIKDHEEKEKKQIENESTIKERKGNNRGFYDKNVYKDKCKKGKYNDFDEKGIKKTEKRGRQDEKAEEIKKRVEGNKEDEGDNEYEDGFKNDDGIEEEYEEEEEEDDEEEDEYEEVEEEEEDEDDEEEEGEDEEDEEDEEEEEEEEEEEGNEDDDDGYEEVEEEEYEEEQAEKVREGKDDEGENKVELKEKQKKKEKKIQIKHDETDDGEKKDDNKKVTNIGNVIKIKKDVNVSSRDVIGEYIKKINNKGKKENVEFDTYDNIVNNYFNESECLEGMDEKNKYLENIKKIKKKKNDLKKNEVLNGEYMKNKNKDEIKKKKVKLDEEYSNIKEIRNMQEHKVILNNKEKKKKNITLKKNMYHKEIENDVMDIIREMMMCQIKMKNKKKRNKKKCEQTVLFNDLEIFIRNLCIAKSKAIQNNSIDNDTVYLIEDILSKKDKSAKKNDYLLYSNDENIFLKSYKGIIEYILKRNSNFKSKKYLNERTFDAYKELILSKDCDMNSDKNNMFDKIFNKQINFVQQLCKMDYNISSSDVHSCNKKGIYNFYEENNNMDDSEKSMVKNIPNLWVNFNNSFNTKDVNDKINLSA